MQRIPEQAGGMQEMKVVRVTDACRSTEKAQVKIFLFVVAAHNRHSLSFSGSF